MSSVYAKIREVLERYGEEFTEGQGGTVWKVQGTPVISHKALERIAAKADIEFDKPTILRAERDEAVILVTGHVCAANAVGSKTKHAWSIGEALVNVNYRVSGKQAAYVYAMAEKRAKDRVILKLVELHGLAYSEEEADEFRGRPDVREPDPREEAAGRFIADCERVIDAETNRATLIAWWNGEDRKAAFKRHDLTQDEGSVLAARVKARAEALADGGRAAA